ncbi:small nuclear ribonucleoprotein g [Anaeramoeba flamelloides]|uniref:Sm protein G n=1 Tax=Anaeramoeba flamelloides TaxID=1746091 RepID=A0AAV7ZGR3_9EUKA|nr:small nuclear ribonucleoprotein g [Anaeramoeba flamelloides]
MASKTVNQTDLRQFMDKRIRIKLNANRFVIGTLRGNDQFMNISLSDAVEVVKIGETTENKPIGKIVIRGNSFIRKTKQQHEANKSNWK